MRILSLVSEAFLWPALSWGTLGVGIYFTIRLGLVQLRWIKHAIDITSGKYDEPAATGTIRHSQALNTALGATIGTGNIAGVGTAIAIGGPGAVLWMWLSGFLGMAIQFASGTLAVKFRKVDENGVVRGGPMYYLEYGLHKRWLGVLFAGLAVLSTFGIGNALQANSIAVPLQAALGIPKVVTGVVFGILIWLVILGGIRRVGRVASQVVPLMVLVYIAAGLGILILHYQAVPAALLEIFKQAVRPTAAMGGFAGAAVIQTLRVGMGRGFFTQDAGLGSSAMAHATAQTEEPIRQGIIAMLGPAIDTILVSSITALVVVITGAWRTGLTGVELTTWAFQRSLPGIGGWIVIFGTVCFAWTTAVSWSYYGETAITYLLGERWATPYRWLYTLVFPFGAVMKWSLAWTLADLSSGLMVLPNLVGVLGLSHVVKTLLQDYQARGKGLKKPDDGTSVLSEGY